MRAAVYEAFGGLVRVREVADPEPPVDGVVLRVEANGLCRSDWHGWAGHDADIELPHVPGHEITGIVEEVGREVRRFSVGDAVVVPFIAGCGACGPCVRGAPQVCTDQYQPGFHGWGGFAERVALPRADRTLVHRPEGLEAITAASLGCRYGTAFHALTTRARVQPGEWVAIHGCGGVGLSAVQIAVAMGARVIAVDVREGALRRATGAGAAMTVNASEVDVVEAIVEETRGGADVSMDAVGHPDCLSHALHSLRAHGRHVQVGLLPDDVTLPLGPVIARELEILGSHGMPAHAYGRLLDLVVRGVVAPDALISGSVGLEAGCRLLMGLGERSLDGMVVVVPGLPGRDAPGMG